MKIGDIASLHPYARLRISSLSDVGPGGERIWSPALTESQKLAYAEREIVNHTEDEHTNTVYCIIIGGGKNND